MDSDHPHSRELAIGDPAPDFHLPASTGSEIALASYRGQAPVVLFFVRAYG
jgi:peroxiredoxin Q/BCP